MLLWILAGLALAIVPFIVVAVNAQRKYRGLFDDEHLLELAALLGRLKAAADDGRAHSELTSHGLAVTWDATRPEIALSHRDGKLHAAAAAFLVEFTVGLVAPPTGATVERLHTHGRHLLRLTLAPGDDLAFRARPVAVPDPDALAALRARAADAIRSTGFDRA